MSRLTDFKAGLLWFRIHFQIGFLVLVVAAGVFIDILDLRVAEFAFHSGRNSQDEAARRNHSPFRDKSAGADNAVRPTFTLFRIVARMPIRQCDSIRSHEASPRDRQSRNRGG